MNSETISIKINNRCISPLYFVKGLKELTGMGLKDAKIIVDSICQKPYKPIEFKTHGVDIKLFSKLLNDLSWDGTENNFEINGDKQWLRESKMLQIGVGNKEDYVEFVKQFIQSSLGNSNELLTFIIDKISKEELQDIVKRIKY